MLEYAVKHSQDGNAAEGLELLPGVHRLLTSLSALEPRVAFGLVSIRPIHLRNTVVQITLMATGVPWVILDL